MESNEAAILIVEDDVNDQAFLSRALKRIGVGSRVSVVNDGEEATVYLRGIGPYADRKLHPLPRLLITDLKMPRMGGLELLGWMKGDERFCLIPAVVLTSSSDHADIAAAYAKGARGYMIKPVQFADLEKLVRTIVDYWSAACIA